jgi:uncharacterized membrane protein (Fun14 family)
MSGEVMGKLTTARVDVAAVSKKAVGAAVATTPPPHKNFLSIDYWFNAVGGTSGLIALSFWTFLGFVLGYLVKRYVRYVIGVVLGIVLVLAVGEYAGVISIHWDVIRDCVHIRSLEDVSMLAAKLYAECRLHIGWYVGAGIGFIVGHMIG